MCGYGGCEPYANAVASGEAAIDRCTPGGEVVLEHLATLTHQSALPYLPDMRARSIQPRTAVIQSASCVGCYKCAEVCPVDAVIGAQGLLHEVLETDCNGCGLCLPACPVDCIELEPAQESFETRYALRDYYTLRQSEKNNRTEVELKVKRQHDLQWKLTSKIGIKRRKAYIEKAQQRVMKHHEDGKKYTADVIAVSGSVSGSED